MPLSAKGHWLGTPSTTRNSSPAVTRILEGPRRPAALAELSAELENVQAAFRWAGEQRRFEMLALALDGFTALHAVKGRAREADSALRDAITAVRAAGDAPGTQLLLGRLMCRRARIAVEIASPDRAAALIEDSLTIFRALGADDDTGDALGVAGALALRQGDLISARWSFLGVRRLARARGDARAAAAALGDLGIVALRRGQLDKAQRLLSRSFARSRAQGDEAAAARWAGSLGDLHVFRGEWSRAADAYRSGLSRLDALGDPYRRAELAARLARALALAGDVDGASCGFEGALAEGHALKHGELVASALHGLGLCAWLRGDHVGARGLLEDALARRRGLFSQPAVAESLEALGRLAAERGALTEAREHLESALRLAGASTALPLALAILVGLAEFQGTPLPSAQRALRAITVHPAADQRTRERAARLCAGRKRPVLRPTPPSSRTAEGSSPELGALVIALLGPVSPGQRPG